MGTDHRARRFRRPACSREVRGEVASLVSTRIPRQYHRTEQGKDRMIPYDAEKPGALERVADTCAMRRRGRDVRPAVSASRSGLLPGSLGRLRVQGERIKPLPRFQRTSITSHEGSLVPAELPGVQCSAFRDPYKTPD